MLDDGDDQVSRGPRQVSWWMAWPREGFTAHCLEHRDRMASDVIGRKVPDQIMGKYIGIHRPIE
jgi:hypothetical protein